MKISIFYTKSTFDFNSSFTALLLCVFFVIFALLSFSIIPIQSGIAVEDSDRQILIALENATFAQLTTVNGNQVLVSVKYQINDDSLKGEKINGIMKIYSSNGSLVKSSSYPDGFTAKKKGGIQDFKSTVKDFTIQNVIVNVTFTNAKKTKVLSNTITANILLKSSGDQLQNKTTSTDIKMEDNIQQGFSLVEKESGSLDNVTFVAAGDFGCSKSAESTIKKMNNSNPDLIIALGDLSYNKFADCWLNMIDPINNDEKVKFVVGDHDIDSDYSRYNAYMKYFNLTKPFYSFDYNNIHFLMMATPKNKEIPYIWNSEQYNFVKNDLEKASQDEDVDWIIVSGFRPFYSSISMHKGQAELRNAYHQMFDKYGVDLVLSAHNHNYQRTFPLGYNNIEDNLPIVKNMNKEIYNYYQIENKSPIFITVGTGGETHHPFKNQAYFVANQLLQRGFLKVSFVDNNETMVGIFYSMDKASIQDKFIVKKLLKK